MVAAPTRFLSAISRRLLRVLRDMIRRLVRVQYLGSGVGGDLPADTTVYYALESNGIIDRLILSLVCREQGLPDPLRDPREEAVLQTPVFYMQQRRGLMLQRLLSRSHPHRLAHIVNALPEAGSAPVMVMSVSILLGRKPGRSGGPLRALLSENWVIAGRLRRALSLFLNGRNTLVQFGVPLDVAKVLQQTGGDRERTIRRVARLLRVEFRQVRTAIIGPDLSHRRTLVDGLLKAPAVQQVIADRARGDAAQTRELQRRARHHAREIAADFSSGVLHVISRFLEWLWERIYEGINVHHLDRLQKIAPGNELIYVPCHRSHVDYLLLSYLLHKHGLVAPHIAAGVNLNLPVLGSILRRGGAFFMRRSFRNNPLYSAVFNEYVSTIVAQGVSIEYFIEGTRSRTGRLLQPHTGMLAMTVRSYLKQRRRPVVFVPVYIGYEKLVEGLAYRHELSGAVKEKESLLGLLRATRVLRQSYGRVHVNFGEPLKLETVLDEHHPDWRNDTPATTSRPPWLAPAVNDLARRIMVRLNSAADVNPVNLLALSLLATRRRAMDEGVLLDHLALCRELMLGAPYSRYVTVTDMSPAEMITDGIRLGVIERLPHELGDIIKVSIPHAILLSYFSNNVSHLFVIASWIASCLQHQASMPVTRVASLGRMVYPFLYHTLFLKWEPRHVGREVRRVMRQMARMGLLKISADGKQVTRPTGGSIKAFQLNLLGQVVLKSFERHFITISVLSRAGSGKLTASELERLCHQLAQRLSVLMQFNAPEFFERRLFRQFIDQLCQIGILERDAERHLTFGKAVQGIADDAKLILSKEIRHGILQMTANLTM